VGYRAVSHADLLNDFISHITQNLSPKLTYQDADLKKQSHPAEITHDAIDRVSSIFKEYLNPNHPEISRWFGRYMSDPKSENNEAPEERIESIDELLEEMQVGATLYRHPASRFAYNQQKGYSMLFVDGEDYVTSSEFAIQLCENRIISITLINAANHDEQKLLLDLYNNGCIYLDE